MQTIANIAVSSSAPLVQEKALLDIVYEQLQGGQIAAGLDDLFEDLSARRKEHANDWPAYAHACLEHPIQNLLHQDPFTRRAFAKPRGYAGDAVMMDYIYGLGEAGDAAAGASRLGRAIFQYMGGRASAQGVRYRRRLIGGLIDRVADNGGTRVLAIAAGHLREVEISSAVRQRKIEELVALDQDEASLAVVARDYANLPVRKIPGSVRQILSGKLNPGQFDFVYAAGLFDYLNRAAAIGLATRMFEMVRPGGLMLIPNFLVDVADSGYMEAFMDWHLIYRDHADMHELAAALPQDALAQCGLFDDAYRAITYLLVSKRTRSGEARR